MGIQNSIGSMAGIVAPAASGMIVASTHHFTAAFLLAAAIGLMDLVGWVWMLPQLAEIFGSARGASAPDTASTVG